ncbi:uncharacterized protein PGTG_08816 [Puccinia graminis f. sp. tritici CRL 75-36-700-3]|uniref:Uncharacterized protein n=1 Tax=Puccinia graminis f. sp. tritici (strain CRL 75-36-700-3 / race SCCL) TaxID=418459 RepID=E3KE87_PUCGT|nr:uncharacterized protein PGTG_08816 [Puccinia graminis f. sp. tritici CRL 75-36-700-3]EFP82620.2 hypothetical protein PGTG_08816 [Puccinia graminis f. sp. tritici CRL 75-36-700-3]
MTHMRPPVWRQLSRITHGQSFTFSFSPFIRVFFLYMLPFVRRPNQYTKRSSIYVKDFANSRKNVGEIFNFSASSESGPTLRPLVQKQDGGPQPKAPNIGERSFEHVSAVCR